MVLNKKIHDIRIGNPKKNSKFLVRDKTTDEIIGGTDDDGKVYGEEILVRDPQDRTKFINIKELISKGSDPEELEKIVKKVVAKTEIKPEQLVTGKLKENVNITVVDGEKHQLVMNSNKGIYEVSDVEEDDPDQPDDDPDKKPQG